MFCFSIDLASIISLTGCFFQLFQTEMPYEFHKSADQITAIEILRKEYDSINTDTPMHILKTFGESEYQTVLDGINGVSGGRNGLEPSTGFDMYVIRITYRNGDMELIGNYSTGYVSADGEILQEHYSFDTEQFYDLISELMGKEITDYTLG